MLIGEVGTDWKMREAVEWKNTTRRADWHHERKTGTNLHEAQHATV